MSTVGLCTAEIFSQIYKKTIADKS